MRKEERIEVPGRSTQWTADRRRDNNNKAHDGDVQGGIDRNILKIIAIIAMVVDHVGEGFADHGSQLYYATQFIGFITGPLFFYMIADGYRRTRNVNRYTANLAIFFVVSYAPFILYFKDRIDLNTMFQFNVMYTLLLGLLMIRIRHELRTGWVKAVLIAGLFVLSAAGDWPFFGPLIILTFDIFHGDVRRALFGYCLVVLFFEASIVFQIILPISDFFDLPTQPNPQLLNFSALANSWHYLGMFLPAVLLSFYRGRRTAGFPGSKWGFYIFYPAHLAVLAAIKHVFLF